MGAGAIRFYQVAGVRKGRGLPLHTHTLAAAATRHPHTDVPRAAAAVITAVA